MEARKGPKMLFSSVSLPGKQSKRSFLISTNLYRSYVRSWRRSTPDGRAHTRVDTTWWPENSTVSAALNLLSCFLCAGPGCRAAMEALYYGEWLRRSSPSSTPTLGRTNHNQQTNIEPWGSNPGWSMYYQWDPWQTTSPLFGFIFSSLM